MSTPLFSIGSYVYLAESASNGNLESYQIQELRQDPSGVWIYKIGLQQRPPTSTATLGDRITGKVSIDLEFVEAELLSLCDALDRAETFYRTGLNKVLNLKSQFCGSEAST